jgi:hypothetical protein
VPVDHSTSARDNLGYIVDVKRDGDTLKLLHQLIGDDAIKLAARNKVSLGIDPMFSDGRGNVFGDCIIHSSLTPIPVVPGQDGFVPLSQGARPAMVFELAAHQPAMSERADLFRRRVELLVNGGHVTPACRDRIIELFQSRSSLLLLSREGQGMDRLLSALEENRAVPIGERSGLQMLSRIIPGEAQAVDAGLQSKMVRMASGAS